MDQEGRPCCGTAPYGYRLEISVGLLVLIMGNTDKFEMIANKYDTSERIQIAKVSSNTNIFMAQVLLHIHDVELVLSRLYEVLNESGHLLIVDFNKNEKIVSDMVHNGFDQAELTDMMTKIGYRDIQSKTFYTGSKIFMGYDASLFILDSRK
ncbi:MAG: class I SAM-dependent methyltransferase [Paenibacillus macerans]|nr:class I SAM-dependent methyltransferase [Paenibacillus macerans]MCY7559877.1 class I SAM-dependent methyltransferase [Paenibacillus macerans]MDU7472520.1 class I SAM-dependent methyltransferase [Paenibacillus macerans]MEC0151483.1 class I SAM-dependent methyltransferase [Paenibacillus macerans]MEC0329366.1 class I SAM-dependent methyltransferase [Paenibacillus macerans]UMV49860.1 class I SAM-dependent methyltransferase [Paenibacillus macerans]